MPPGGDQLAIVHLIAYARSMVGCDVHVAFTVSGMVAMGACIWWFGVAAMAQRGQKLRENMGKKLWNEKIGKVSIFEKLGLEKF